MQGQQKIKGFLKEAFNILAFRKGAGAAICGYIALGAIALGAAPIVISVAAAVVTAGVATLATEAVPLVIAGFYGVGTLLEVNYAREFSRAHDRKKLYKEDLKRIKDSQFLSRQGKYWARHDILYGKTPPSF